MGTYCDCNQLLKEKITAMDKQTETNGKENAKAVEASLMLKTEVKQEPPDAECGEPCANVYDVLFDVVKHEVGDDAAGASLDFSAVQVKREPSQSKAIFPTDILNKGSSLPADSDDKSNIKTCVVVFYDFPKVPMKVSPTREESQGAVGCGIALTQRRSPAGHVDTPSKSYACDICSYRSVRKSTLVRHMMTHTGEKRYACKLCEFKCAGKSDLVKHNKRTHTGEKPYACTMCSYKSGFKSALVRHMRTHTGEKPYACSICNFKSGYKGSLDVHMRIHTGEKCYACRMCNYKSGCQGNLNKHMKIHTGERPYACTMCSYRSKQKCNLVSHMRSHGSEKPYACRICSYKSRYQRCLITHMKIHAGK